MNCKNWLFSLLALWFTLTIQNVYAADYALKVNTIPQGADVRILNIVPKFRQGMLLPAGKYELKVSKAGYPTRTLEVDIVDKNVTVDVILGIVSPEDIPDFAEEYALSIHTIPQDADIKIMNISPSFYQGIVLAPGKYDIRVAKEGYATRDTTVTIAESDVSIDVELVQNLPTKATELNETVSDDAVDTDTEETVVDTAKEQYELYIDVVPEDASIKLANQAFEQGTLLEVGKYDVVISKAGYQSVNQTVEIVDKEVTLTVELKKNEYALSVNIEPKDATIKIMNIKPKFTQGILLAPGSYQLNVSKEGYETYDETVEIVDKAVTVEVELMTDDAEDTAEIEDDEAIDDTDDENDEAADDTDDETADDTDEDVDETASDATDNVSNKMTMQAVESKETVVVPVESKEPVNLEKKTDVPDSTLSEDVKKDEPKEVVAAPVESKEPVNSEKKTDVPDSTLSEDVKKDEPKEVVAAPVESKEPVNSEKKPAVVNTEEDEIDDSDAEEDDSATDDEADDDVDEEDDSATDDGDDEADDMDDEDDSAIDDEDGEADDVDEEDDSVTNDKSADANEDDGKEEDSTEEDKTEIANANNHDEQKVVNPSESKVETKVDLTKKTETTEQKTVETPVITSEKPVAIVESTEQPVEKVASVDKSNLATEALKTPILKPEILCFAFEENRKIKDQTEEMTIIHNSIIKLDNRFVEAVYDVYIKPSNLSYHYDFKGVKKGKMFDLIGILYYDDHEQDVNSDMSIEGKKLIINIKNGSDGDFMSNDVLKQTSCDDVIS